MKKFLILTLSLLLTVTLLVACQEEAVVPGDTVAETLTEAVPETQADTDAGTQVITEFETQAITEPVTEPITEAPTEAITEAPTVEETETALDSAEVVTEVVEETEGETTPETTPPEASLPDAEDIFFAALDAQQFEGMTNYAVNSELVLDIIASMNGMETKMTMTGNVSAKQQSENAASVEISLPGREPYSLIYLEGALYVSSGEEKYRCAMDEVEFALLLSELLGDLLASEETPGETPDGMPEDAPVINPGDLGLGDQLTALDLSALFADITVTEDSTTGDITVTLAGLSQDAQFMINSLLSSISNSGMEGATDEDISMMLDLLAAFDMDTMAFSLTVDADLLLKEVAMSFGLDLTSMPEMTGDVPMTMVMTLTTSLDRSEQIITAPEDADTYVEKEWREIFGIYSAEYLGLIPDDNGVITLSEEPELFVLQYQYILNNYTDFEGSVFSVTARICDFNVSDEGWVEAVIYQVGESGIPAEETYLAVYIPAEVAADMTLPKDHSVVKLTAYLPTEEDGELYYYDYIITAYELVSGPVSVG
ncbi:MAG: hypothetical protein E7661_10410 [Ruminococcaceae bacterium]|nr:hypothetical protein [Oscillospiraceae bacterium]